jgi:hypothetical protein
MKERAPQQPAFSNHQSPPNREGGGLREWAWLAVPVLAIGAVVAPRYINDLPFDMPGSEPDIIPAADVQPLSNSDMTLLRDQYPRDEVFTTVIDGFTYSWPVGRPHRGLFKIALPCDIDATTPQALNEGKIPCHHHPVKDAPEYVPEDNIAMDFVYRDAAENQEAIFGEPVRAIVAGTIAEVEEDTRWGENCSSVSLQGDDGHYYYYGHLSDNYFVTDEQRVNAGDQIAEVGAEDCGQGVAHVHIEMIDGGSRNPYLIELLEKLYRAIPE